jgi:hypothetical protein
MCNDPTCVMCSPSTLGDSRHSVPNPIVKQDLLAWLHGIDEDGIVGLAAQTDDCPLARYCTVALGLTDINIGPGGIRWIQEEQMYFADVDIWMQQFMEAVDAQGSRTPIEAHEAISYLADDFVFQSNEDNETYDDYEEDDDDDEDEGDHDGENPVDGCYCYACDEMREQQDEAETEDTDELEVLDLTVTVRDTVTV